METKEIVPAAELEPLTPAPIKIAGRTLSSPKIEQICSALSLAQGSFKAVMKNAINPHFKNRYADLSSIIDSTRDALTENGLSFSQFPSLDQGRIVLTTILFHKSGQYLTNEVSLKATADTPQAAGSTITYGRRYGLSTLLGICADDDDDANAGSFKKQDNLPRSEQRNATEPKPPPAGASTAAKSTAKEFVFNRDRHIASLRSRVEAGGYSGAIAEEIANTAADKLNGMKIDGPELLDLSIREAEIDIKSRNGVIAECQG
jgi:hypothetical protein